MQVYHTGGRRPLHVQQRSASVRACVSDHPHHCTRLRVRQKTRVSVPECLPIHDPKVTQDVNVQQVVIGHTEQLFSHVRQRRTHWFDERMQWEPQ